MKPDLRLLLKGSSRNLFVASLIAAFIWGGILIANAWLIADLIIRIIDLRDVRDDLTYLIVLWIFRSIFLALFENWTSSQAIKLKAEMRERTTENSYGLRQFSPSVISNLLTKGLNSIDIYFGRFIPQVIFALITPAMLIVTLALRDLLSAVAALITLPLIPFFGALIGRYTADAVARKWRTLGQLSSYFEDSLRGFATLKIFGRHSGQSQRIEAIGQRYSDETMKVLRISFLSSLALELAATISVAVIAVEIGLRLVGGHMQFHSALMILILAPEIYFPLRNAAALFHTSTDGSEAMAKIESLPHQTKCENGLVPIPDGIQFWVGPSGTGKTRAAMELINRIGCTGIGWVPQNPRLARGSIRKQFQLIRPTISDEEIIDYLNSVGLKVSDLPNGLDSILESGNELLSAASGGQVRKIALARALASNPRFLIADEPTADLDLESAKVVMQALRAQRVPLIIITHDLELLKASDPVRRFE